MIDIQNYPLVRILLFLAAGIVTIHYRLLPGISFVWLGLMAVMIFGIYCFSKKPVAGTLCLFASAYFLGGCITILRENNLHVGFPHKPFNYQGVVVSEPQPHGKVVQFDLHVVSTARPFLIKASLLRDTIAGLERNLHVGDGISVYSLVEKPADNADSPFFDNSHWYAVKGYSGHTFIYYTNWQKAVVSLKPLSFWQRARIRLLVYRQRCYEQFERMGLSTVSFGVIAAMTLGDKSALTDSVLQAFSGAGVSHMLALSGLHLGIIYFLLTFLLPSRRCPLLVQVFSISAVWCFVFFVGMPHSAVRSAIMISVYGLMSLANRRKASLNVLAFAAILILIVRPLSLWDVGFQLSFMSVLGIVILPWNHLMSGIKSVDYVLSTLLVSFGAQLMVLPLVMYYFGTVPLYFFISNLAASLASMLIIVSAVVLLLLGPFAEVQVWFARVVSWGIDCFYRFLQLIGEWPCALLTYRISLFQIVLIYIFYASVACIAFRFVYYSKLKGIDKKNR